MSGHIPHCHAGRVSGYQAMSGDGYPGAGGEKLGYNPGKIHDKTFYGESRIMVGAAFVVCVF